MDESTSRQLEGVKVENLFTDKVSGKDVNRTQLALAINFARKGGTLIVHSMDRMVRNLEELQKVVRELTMKGVHVEFVKEHLTFTEDDSPINKLLLSMPGAVAEFERSMILERQREGIAIAKSQGKYKGRRPSLTLEQVAQLKQRRADGETVTAPSKDSKISRSTVCHYPNQANTTHRRSNYQNTPKFSTQTTSDTPFH
ncbi:recombinase family protein [Corynebacterium felinum]